MNRFPAIFTFFWSGYSWQSGEFFNYRLRWSKLLLCACFLRCWCDGINQKNLDIDKKQELIFYGLWARPRNKEWQRQKSMKNRQKWKNYHIPPFLQQIIQQTVNFTIAVDNSFARNNKKKQKTKTMLQGIKRTEKGCQFKNITSTELILSNFITLFTDKQSGTRNENIKK